MSPAPHPELSKLDLESAPLPSGGGNLPRGVDSLTVFVAPWALPTEEVPILIQWTPDHAVEWFEFQIPEGFTVVNHHNIAQFKVDKGVITASDFRFPGFAAVYLKCHRVPDEVICRVPFLIKFRTNGGRETTQTHNLTVVRPMVEFAEGQTELVITEKSLEASPDKTPLVIHLRHTGLGVVNLQIRCWFRGQVISQNQDIIRGILRRAIELFPEKERAKLSERDGRVAKEAKDARLEIEIDPLQSESVERIHDQLMELLSRGSLPADLTSDVSAEELKTMFEKFDTTAFNELVQSQIYTLYTRYLLDGIRRYPSGFSEIQGGPAGVRVDATTDEIRVQVKYRDSQDNEYGPIESRVLVNDRRENKPPIMLPVRVDIETRLLKGLME
jgi:hypothetical protein